MLVYFVLLARVIKSLVILVETDEATLTRLRDRTHRYNVSRLPNVLAAEDKQEGTVVLLRIPHTEKRSCVGIEIGSDQVTNRLG